MYSATRCLGWGRDGWRRDRAGYPWWLGSAGDERWWWSGGATKASGKEVEGAPGVGAELRAVMESLEGDQGGISWWLNDGGTLVQWRQWAEEEKGSSRGGALLLKAARGGDRGWRKRWADKAAATV
jgi:hypothetical protein